MILVAPSPRFIFDNKSMKGNLDKVNSGQSLDISFVATEKEEDASVNAKETADEEDSHTFVEIINYSNQGASSDSSSSGYKEKNNGSSEESDARKVLGVMPIASGSKKTTKPPSEKGLSNSFEVKFKKLADKLQDILFKLQTPSFKLLIICCYIALITSSVFNTVFCTSMQSVWSTLGGPTMVFGMITIGICSATLVWYLAKPEPLHGFEEIPYVLSVSAWSDKFGPADLMIQMVLFFGWITIGIKQISFMISVDDSYPKNTKPLSFLTVFSYVGIISSLFPITLIKILEHNIIFSKRKTLKTNQDI